MVLDEAGLKIQVFSGETSTERKKKRNQLIVDPN